MVLVQDLLRTFQVQIVLRIFSPGKTYKRLQIVQLHIELRTLGIQVVQFVSLLVEYLTDLIRPVLVLGLPQQFEFFW